MFELILPATPVMSQARNFASARARARGSTRARAAWMRRGPGQASELTHWYEAELRIAHRPLQQFLAVLYCGIRVE